MRKAADIIRQLLEDDPDDIDPKEEMLKLPPRWDYGMIYRGSQARQNIKYTDYEVVGHDPDDENKVILLDRDCDDYELWTLNDNHAGYVVEIDGKGYEFVRSLRQYDPLFNLIKPSTPPPKAFHGGFGGSLFPISGGGQG